MRKDEGQDNVTVNTGQTNFVKNAHAGTNQITEKNCVKITQVMHQVHHNAIMRFYDLKSNYQRLYGVYTKKRCTLGQFYK